MTPYVVALLLFYSVLILRPILHVALTTVPCHNILVHCIWQNNFSTF